MKANQPTLRAEIEDDFAAAPAGVLDTAADLDKGHGRIEQRTVTVSREADWLAGDRRFPGELRLPGVTTIVKVRSRTELKDRCRTDTRYYISSADLTAETAAQAVRGHWGIENRLHWVLDVVFREDQARLRTGHGAKNMAVVRHFAINLVRTATDKKTLKLRRKLAGWDRRYRGGPGRLDRLAALLRCIPVADQAAQIPLKKFSCCCWACGDVGKASALSIISSRPVSYASAGVRPSRAECGRAVL